MPPMSKEERKAYMKAYREANKEKIAAQRKAYREANIEVYLEREKAYREANKEKIAEYQKAHYKANKGSKRAYRKAYYEANKERVSEQKKAYREANKEKIKAHYKANKEKYIAYSKKRKALKKKLIPKPLRKCPIETGRLIKIYKLRAVISEATGIDHHVDHIWPLSDGGPHWSGNLQIITAEENLSKSASVCEETKKVIQESLEYALQEYKKEKRKC